MSPWIHFLWRITQWGDEVATSAAACGCFVALALRKQWGLAFKFLGLLIGVVVIEVASKMVFYGWGVQFGIASFHGMSGHVLRAIAVWPTLGFVVFAGSSRAMQLTGAALGALIALCVLSAELALYYHTPVEAIVGLLVGSLVPLLFAKHDRLVPLRAGVQVAIIAAAVLVYWRVPRGRFDYEEATADTAQALSHRVEGTPCGKNHDAVACEHGGKRRHAD